MTTLGKIRRLFPGGNTSKGFYSFFSYMIGPDAKRLFIIKGGPGVGKSSFMKYIGQEMINRGFDVEYHHCSSDPDSIDGIVIPSIGVGICDGTAPHIIDPQYPGIVDEIINLGDFWDEEKIAARKDDIIDTKKRSSKRFKIVYSLLKESKVAYDEWKGYVEDSVDRGKYLRIVKILLETVFEDVVGNYGASPKARHLFASSITPKGFVNYIDTLVTQGMKIYAIKGEPGTGVKELVERVAQAAGELGLYTEQFHCPYEPDKLDLLIIPALNVMIANTSQPYHPHIEKLEDIVIEDTIDLNLCINYDELQYYKDEIEDAKSRYDYLLDKAVVHLKKAKEIHGEVEKFYIKAMNFDEVNKKREEILERILTYAGL